MPGILLVAHFKGWVALRAEILGMYGPGTSQLMTYTGPGLAS